MIDLSTVRFCFIAGTLAQGGAERQLFYVLKTLRALGARPRVLCLMQGEFWEEKLAALQIPVTWIGSQQARAQRLWQIIKLLRDAPPDVIQSQHFYTNLYAAVAARALRRREVGALRSHPLSDVQADPLLGRFSLRVPRRLAANSRAAIANAIELGVPAARLHLLPNVVDTKLFQPRAPQIADTVTLLAVGRMTAEKRFDLFINALAALQQGAERPVKGLLVGDGPLRRQLEEQARQLHLTSETLEFRGRVAEMKTIYQEADALVLTSDYEGTPNVVLEAMAAGLPIVATPVGDLPEIVRHGKHGFLLTQSANQLVETLLPLLSNPHLRIEMGRQARAHVVAQYSLQRLSNYLTDFYRNVLS
jgi:glycosyltransferase involved in cell wall biosynthesis